VKQNSISKVFFTSNLLISFSAVLGVFLVWVGLFVSDYNAQSHLAIQDYIDTQKRSLQSEIGMVADFIHQQHLESENRQRNELRSEVEQAIAMLQQAYEQTPQRSPSEALFWALQSIKSLRNERSESPFFVHKYNGQVLFNPMLDSLLQTPVLPDSSSKHIQEVLGGFSTLLEGRQQGYYTYRWWRPRYAGMDHLKTAYIRSFEPFELYVGLALYHDELDSLEQKRILSSLSRFRFGAHGSLFVLDGDSKHLLSNPDLTDERVMTTLKSIANSGGGFVLKDDYILFLQPVHEWNWRIGLGMRLSELEKMTQQHRTSLKVQLRKFALTTSLLLVLFLGLAFTLSYFNTQRMKRYVELITRSFQVAETNLTPIPPESINLEEFRQVAQSANQLMEARARIDKERETLLWEIDQKSREFEQILYIASHDLRAPLVNLQGFTMELGDDLKVLLQLLEANTPPSPEEWTQARIIRKELETSMQFIDSSTNRLDRILQGLLAYSRLGRISPQNTVVDCSLMIQDLLASMEYRLREKRARIHVSLLPNCYADPLLVQQIFQNLLDNALKYSQPDVPAEITIQGKAGTEFVVYSIADNGIGIESSQQAKLFDLFYRAGDNPNVKGDGLGLALVLRMVRRMHGRIWVESKLGVGSTFFLELAKPPPEALAIADSL